jgi:2-dehydro-3-deoxyphosphogluconate aldolase / (4S)-4-hydroxy-2-oxoglutarate aldolase
VKKDEIRERILEVGIVPVVRANSPGEAAFAAQAVSQGGIPIVEITMTVPGAIGLISELVRYTPEVLVGAGTVLDAETARLCLDAGAQFLVSPGFDMETVKLAAKEDVVIMAGALTPTELMAACRAGADFVKIFPCAQVGGAAYIKALKGPFPQVPLVPTGGVNLETAANFIAAGAAALGVGGELIDRDAIQSGRSAVIENLARKFMDVVRNARNQVTPQKPPTVARA